MPTTNSFSWMSDATAVFLMVVSFLDVLYLQLWKTTRCRFRLQLHYLELILFCRMLSSLMMRFPSAKTSWSHFPQGINQHRTEYSTIDSLVRVVLLRTLLVFWVRSFAFSGGPSYWIRRRLKQSCLQHVFCTTFYSRNRQLCTHHLVSLTPKSKMVLLSQELGETNRL